MPRYVLWRIQQRRARLRSGSKNFLKNELESAQAQLSKVRSQAKEAAEMLREKLKAVVESEAKERVAELESALAGAEQASTQQHKEELKSAQAQLSKMAEKEHKLRSQAKEAVEMLREKLVIS
jgi:chromosome segregation ATPase